jgi:hypothetical protein
MTAAETIQVSQDLADIASGINNAIGDPNINPTAADSAAAQTAVTDLTNASNAVANSAALQALKESAADFAKIRQGGADAKAALTRIQGDVAKVNGILAIAGAAVTLATSLTPAGPIIATITAAASGLSATARAA